MTPSNEGKDSTMTQSESNRLRLAAAAYLSKHRTALQLPQREIADTLKVGAALVSRIETANRMVAIETVSAFLDLFAEHYKVDKFAGAAEPPALPAVPTPETAANAIEHLVASGLSLSDIGRAVNLSSTTIANVRTLTGTYPETRIAVVAFASKRLPGADFTTAPVKPAVAVEAPRTTTPTTIRTPTSVRCKLVAREKLADELTFDGTAYTFQSLPDGQILVTKGA